MRKLNKIVSLILVVALLCGVLVIPNVASAADEGDSGSSSFAPSAQWATAADALAALSSKTGNLFKSATLANWNEDSISAKLVTPADGDNYITLVAEADTTSKNHYLLFGGTGSNGNLDFSGYYVIEMDIASEGTLIERFTVNPIISFSGSSSSTRLDPNPEDQLYNHTELSDGNWHHYAMVGDLASNQLYIYIDGELVGTKNAYNATNKATQDAANASTVYTLDSIRVNIGGGATTTVGNSLSIDNVSLTVGASGAYGTAPAAEKLPAVASVNGVEYSNVKAATKALSGIFPVNAEILREYAGTITVDCDATVDTHGINCNLTSSVAPSVNGTVYTYDFPFKSSVTETDSVSDSTIVAELGLGETVAHGGSGNYSDTTVKPYLVTDVGTGNVYLDIRPGASFSTSDATHNHFNFRVQGAKTVYEQNSILVVTLDYYHELAVMHDSYIGITTRNAASGNIGGNRVDPKDLGLNAGEWSRITLIGDVAANLLYVYVNGALVKTVSKGVYNTDAFETGYYFEGVRINVATKTNLNANQNLALDNFYIDVNNTDEWLLANKGANSLDGWTNAPTHELPTPPALATVDGEVYYNVASLNEALMGNKSVNVELYRDCLGTITVNCDATVDTHGYTVPAVGTSGTRTQVDSTTVYTYDLPFQQSANSTVVTDNNTIISAIKSDVAGNLFTSIQNNITSTQGMKSEIVTNTVQGGNYLRVTPDGTENNAYFEVQSMTSIPNNANTQFYVLDMDIAILDKSVTVGFMSVPRSGSGLWGAANPTINSILGSYDAGEMQHVTAVVNIDTNTMYVFVNGAPYQTFAGNGYTSAANHTSYFAAGKTINFNGFRIGSNLGGSGVTQTAPDKGYTIDNVALRYVEEAASGYAADSLSAAMATGNVNVWANAVTEVATHSAPLAKVDGEYVGSAAALNALLNGRGQYKNVELLRDETAAITVNTNAVVETNGLNVTVNQGANVESVETVGTKTTYTIGWIASAVEVLNNSTSFTGPVSNVSGNMFSSVVNTRLETNFNLYDVTEANGNTYLKLVPKDAAVNASGPYLAMEKYSNYTPISSLSYFVIDISLASETGKLPTINIGPFHRNSADSGYSNGGNFNAAPYVTDDSEFTHFTLVGDYSSNTLYVFVNGNLVSNTGKAYAEADPGCGFRGVRINLVDGSSLDGVNILVDNFAVRTFTADDALASAITAGSLEGWSGNISDAAGELPSIATVDGKEYSSVSELETALMNGKNHAISLDRPVNATAYASSTATITTNGLANFITAAAGYALEDNGDGTYSVVIQTKFGSITVNINGEQAIKADLLYGTDIADYLNEYNAYAFNVIADDNGNLYTGASWDVAPTGVVDGDEVFNVTATLFADDYLVLDASGNVVDTAFEDALTANTVYTIFMNADYEIGTAQLAANGTKTVYMAGHTITFAKANASMHVFMPSSKFNSLVFVGGSIVDDVRAHTQALFYLVYDCTGEIKVVNCDVYAVANLGNIRGGTLTIENSDVVIFETMNAYAVQLGEYYNAGYTYNKCAFNLIDSTFRYNHASAGRSQAPFVVKDYSEWNGTTTDQDRANAISRGADTIAHEINISGSTVYCDFGTGLLNNPKDEEFVLTIDNSQLNAKTLCVANAGTVVIGENVVSGTSISGAIGATFGNGVVEVKSGDPEAPYAYTSYYATVVWSNGDVEKWADGATPFNPACPTDKVCVVEAGTTYTFEAAESLNIQLKANVSLGANLTFNAYVPTSVALTEVVIGNIPYSIENAPVVSVGGVECYLFEYELAPYLAAQSFAIELSTAEYTVAKSLSLAEYAELVASAYADNTNAVNLAKALVKYAAASHYYVGNYVDGYVTANGYAPEAAPDVEVNPDLYLEQLEIYFESVSLNLGASPKWMFKLAEDADTTNLEITLNDEEVVEYEIVDGYVVFEVRAYDLLDKITLFGDEIYVEYDFATYYNYVQDNVYDLSATNWQARGNVLGAECYYMTTGTGLLDALYTYAYYAQAYNG